MVDGPAWTALPADSTVPPDILDVRLTEWASACDGPVMDGGHYAWIVANGVRAGGHYPIIDSNVIGGDGSGQGTVLMGNVRSLEVSTSFPCGFSDDFEKQGIKTGTLSVERLDADGVAGTLTVNLPSGATATASFAGSYCAKPRAPTTIGCDK